VAAVDAGRTDRRLRATAGAAAARIRARMWNAARSGA